MDNKPQGGVSSPLGPRGSYGPTVFESVRMVSLSPVETPLCGCCQGRGGGREEGQAGEVCAVAENSGWSWG